MHPRHRRDIPIKALRAFIAISEHGSFSKAAEELNLTQPAISAQIKGLQRILGDDLFFKKTEGVGLSELGLVVERYARRILTLNDQITATAGRTTKHETVYLGIQSVFARTVLPEVVKISQAADNMRYRFVCASAKVLAERHKSGYVDLVFMLAPTESRRNVLAEWNEKPVWVRAPHLFPMSDGEPIPFVSHQNGFMDRKVLEVLDERNVAYRIVFSASDIASMIAAVEAGIGLMIMPDRVIPESLIVAHERILPKLPELRAGVFCREGFDLARHMPLVTAFISAVQPPSAKVVRLLNTTAVPLKAVQSTR